MRRFKTLLLLFCMPFMLCLTLSVSAHTGGTDSKGGHTNHSTGEYHYHHGYPAHDHYDMDGDGDVDCPYDFDDQTDIFSGNSSAGNYYSSNKSNSTVNPVSKPETIIQTVKEEVPYIPSWMYWIIGILAFVFLCSLVVIKWKNDDIRNLKEQYTKATNEHNQAVAEITAANAAEIGRLTQVHYNKVQDLERSLGRLDADKQALFSEYISLRKQFSLFLSIALNLLPADKANQISYFRQDLKSGTISIPDNVFFLSDSTPVAGKVSIDKPFGDYTVYVSRNGTCYHTDRFCSGYSSKPCHLYETILRHRPCKKCVYHPFTEIPDWYIKIKALTKKGESS